MQVTIGIDCSLRKVGLVAYSGEGISATTIEPDTSLPLVQRMHHIYVAVQAFLHAWQPAQIEGIYLEALAFNANGRLGDLGGCHHIARLACFHWWQKQQTILSLVMEDIPSSQVRKQVLGKAPPKKIKVKEWIEQVMKEMGLPLLANDHERDAYLTARAGAELSVRGELGKKKSAKSRKSKREPLVLESVDSFPKKVAKRMSRPSKSPSLF
jgi:Holliday junction resolvasome RuvABC endonuclease subunit